MVGSVTVLLFLGLQMLLQPLQRRCRCLADSLLQVTNLARGSLHVPLRSVFPMLQHARACGGLADILEG